MEVFLLISVAFIVYPNNVYLNRGNHEDHVLNLRYIFILLYLHSKIFEILSRLVTILKNIFIINNKLNVTRCLLLRIRKFK